MDKVLSRKLQAGSPPTWLTSGVGNGPLSSRLSKKVQLTPTTAQSLPPLCYFSPASSLTHFPYKSLNSSHSREYMEATLKLGSLGLK